MVKEYFTIGELASLRKVSTETLRHYDRIDLLKPEYIDSSTNYRYYSFSQGITLGVIIELRQLGIGLHEIKLLIKSHNVEHTLNALNDKGKELDEQIEELISLRNIIKQKVSNIKQLSDMRPEYDMDVLQFKPRQVLLCDQKFSNFKDVNIGYFQLEHNLTGVAPTLASNRVALIVSHNLQQNAFEFSPSIFVDFVPNKKSKYDHVIPGGLYIRTFARGSGSEYFDWREISDSVNLYTKKHGYKIEGNMIIITHIDQFITSKTDQLFCEVQVPVSK